MAGLYTRRFFEYGDFMENSVLGRVHSIESFGSVDGPGVRFIVFLQGCKMRCAYCHNPDTWKIDDGEFISADDLLKKAMRYKSYWKNNGGITVSGGEPLLQIDFLLEFFKKAKENGINTCIDTSGNAFSKEEPFFSKFEELMKYTDLLLLDIKHINSEKHKQITAQPNENILDMAKYLSDINKPVWIRHVLVPTLTDDENDLEELNDFISGLSNVEKVEILPYHTLGKFKWDNLKIPYRLDGIKPPSEDLVKKANEILHTDKY